MGDDVTRGPGRKDEVAVKDRKKTAKPRLYKVLLHNDDYTTMEFVVQILVEFFHKSRTEATHVMLHVHHKGIGVAGVYPYDVANTKVVQVTEAARGNGMPLLCTMEPE
jgi:ATP-dependent Clp protease adaptor protein ClpS